MKWFYIFHIPFLLFAAHASGPSSSTEKKDLSEVGSVPSRGEAV
jgi:hypothetical protein